MVVAQTSGQARTYKNASSSSSSSLRPLRLRGDKFFTIFQNVAIAVGQKSITNANFYAIARHPRTSREQSASSHCHPD